MARIRIRPLLIGLAAGLLVGVAAVPSTRWLPALQLRMLVQPDAIGCVPARNMGPDPSRRSSASLQALVRAAARHPDEYTMQIGLASLYVSGPGGQAGYAARLRALEKRFPNTPSVYANAIRMADTRIARPDLEPEPYPVPEPEAARRLHDGEAAALMSDAAAGARLEPDNAYFPFMSAVALLRLHRDAEAVAALERAGRCKEWREYHRDEVTGVYALYGEAFGSKSAYLWLSISYGVLFPQYARLRSVARATVALAGRAEAAGDFARGAAIRTSLARCGSLMRVQSSSLIGTLVGTAITNVAASNPGGVPDARTADSGARGDAEREERVARCVAYLRSNGQGAAASDLEHANDLAFQMRDITRKSVAEESWVRDTFAPAGLTIGWVAGLALLANVLTIVVALALLWAGFLSPDVREQRAIGAAAGFATLFGLAMGSLTLVSGAAFGCVVGLAVGLLAVAFWYAQARPEVRPNAKRAGAWMAGAAVTALVVANTARFVGYPAYGLLDAASTISFGRSLTIPAPVMGGALLPVLLVGCVIGVLVRRRPLVTGTVRTFRACAPIVVWLLLIAYGCDTIQTARWDARIASEQPKWLDHEGRYAAERAGLTWPGL